MASDLHDPVPECPRCKRPVPIEPGGWGHRYAQVLLHLDHCAPQLRAHERLAIARELVPYGFQPSP